MPEFTTTVEAARRTGVNRLKIARWCREKILKDSYLDPEDGCWKLNYEEFLTLLDAATQLDSEISVIEAAEIVPFEAQAIRIWCEQGLIRAHRPHKEWRIDRNSLMAFTTPPKGWLTCQQASRKYYYHETHFRGLHAAGHIRRRAWHSQHIYFEPDIIAYLKRPKQGVNGRDHLKQKAAEWYIAYFKGYIPDKVLPEVKRQCSQATGAGYGTADKALTLARRKLKIVVITNKSEILREWLVANVYIWKPYKQIYEEVAARFKRFAVSESTIQKAIMFLRREVRETEYECLDARYLNRSQKEQYELSQR